MKKIDIENKITNALLELMKEEPYEDISITDITSKAGLSRATYYRHFNSKEDIVIKYFENTKQRFLDSLKLNNDNKKVNNEIVIYSLFLFFKANMDANKCLRNAKLDGELLKFLSNEFLDNLPVKLDKFLAYFIAGALFNVCINWLDNDCKDPIDEVIKPFITIEESLKNNVKL